MSYENISDNLWIYDGELEATPGSTISGAADDLVAYAKETGETQALSFNGIELIADGSKAGPELAKVYWEESDRRREEYLASDEYRERMKEAERKESERKNALEDLLATAPDNMTLKDSDAWDDFKNKNTDPYGGAVVTYAERWARLMESALSRGESIESSAKRTSSLADNEGITGFMYGAAVHTLSQVWEHGDTLRQWHNKKYGVESETGTVNPAVITIG